MTVFLTSKSSGGGILERGGQRRCSRKEAIQACNCIKKETPAHVFSCQYCEIFKNTFFEEHLPMAGFGSPKEFNDMAK